MRAENASQATLESYFQGLKQLAVFVAGREYPFVEVTGVTREHCEAFLTDLLERWKPATALTRWKALRRFYDWLVEEGEVEVSPMAKVRPPRVPEQPPEVLTLEA